MSGDAWYLNKADHCVKLAKDAAHARTRARYEEEARLWREIAPDIAKTNETASDRTRSRSAQVGDLGRFLESWGHLRPAGSYSVVRAMACRPFPRRGGSMAAAYAWACRPDVAAGHRQDFSARR